MWYLPILEKNLLPDWLIRVGIRRLLAERLQKENRGDIKRHLSNLIEELKAGPIAIHTNDANDQHYQVPSEFFKLVLGERLKYSCAYWPEGTESLNDAELQMLKLWCKRAQIENGQKILDLGCGWGSLCQYLAETYPQSRVVGVCNSKTQKAFIESRAKQSKLNNLRIIAADMNTFQISEKFDRIMSLEMFEHMRNYQKLLQKISTWMNPEALLFLHIFVHKELAYPFEVDGSNDWMARNYFTGGIMPSANLLLYFQDHVSLVDRWRVSGRHYQKTSEAWLSRMTENRDEIMSLFTKQYGPEDAVRKWVNWRVFFMACSELFGYHQGSEWFVSHYLFERK